MITRSCTHCETECVLIARSDVVLREPKGDRLVLRLPALALDEPAQATLGQDRPAGRSRLDERDDNHPPLREPLDRELHLHRVDPQSLSERRQIDVVVRMAAQLAQDGGVELVAGGRGFRSWAARGG